MKKIYISAIACFLSTFAIAQDFSLLSSTQDNLTIEHQFTELSARETNLNGVDYWNFDKTYKINSMKKGAPALPTFSESLIIPNQGKSSITIEHDGFEEYTNVNITPSKGSLKRNINPDDIPYEFGIEYQTDAFYPAEIATLSTPYNLRNTRGITVRFSPYQYNPVTKTLRVYKNIRASVSTDLNQEGINELAFSSPKKDAFNSIYKNHYINSENTLGRYTPVEEQGEMLVITYDDFQDAVQPLVDWKIRSGIKTTVATITDTGATDEEIKAYVETFYEENPNLVFVLLVGDHDQVPSHTYGITSAWEELWSDTYYGQLEGDDFYPELFVGRLSGANSDEITIQIDRTLEYEKNPAAGTWMQKAIGIASNEGEGYGDDGESDWEHARNNRAKFLEFGYTEVFEFYDGSQGGADADGNPNSSAISDAVNEGVGLINYTGHGAQNVCVTGNYGSNHINEAVNNGKYPFVISVACNNGTFTAGECISETWLLATNENTPTGAIAATGSSILMAWAEPMQTQDEMTDIITEAHEDNHKITLGGIFYNSQMSMLEEYTDSPTAIEVMQTWVMFGDPSTIFRTKETMDMTVAHVESIVKNATAVTINCDIDDTLITISQNGEILNTGIAQNGSVEITLEEYAQENPLVVIGVKQNYLPYQGEISVTDEVINVNEEIWNNLIVYPNPASDQLNLNWNKNLAIEKISIMDLTGKIVYSSDISDSITSKSINTSSISSGMYILKVSSNESSKTSKISIK
ncbi:C25 family cysteine peptidase [Aureivirga sp. CE67]|uniref:C25 family cysteine peptidase n=1 Tax=Aureivirga sp. CE67 TaxID=1788983 RepID=UPI0018C9245B|nr:C25 family cysteine peptidase [Aureivirga sp. CE67]